jgi:hypothetical protein
MVRELAGEMGVDVAWHTGSLPQVRRRAEINRFKNDPACRLFLSTDSGSVGLNLQAASAVVNVDLPWNPAKLEQRIARAWRKNQTRSVAVINLVTEDSIEHSMLYVLGAKQALADGVLDGAGDLAALKMPSGRGAFIERMKAMMDAPARPAPALRVVAPEEALAADLVARHGDKALLIEARHGAGPGRARLLAVLDLDPAGLEAEAARLSGVPPEDAPLVGATAEGGGLAASTMAVEVIDRATWLAMQRLAATGLLLFAHEPRVLYRSAAFVEGGGEAARADGAAAADEARRVMELTARLMEEADRALRKARLLTAGGFPEDAPPLLLKALQKAAAARLAGCGELPPGVGAPSDLCASDAEIRRLAASDALPAAALEILDATHPSAGAVEPGRIDTMVGAAERFVAAITGAGGAGDGAGNTAADTLGNIAGSAAMEPRQAA